MSAASRAPDPSGRARLFVLLPVLTALGVLLGVYGALLLPAGPRIHGQLLSAGAAIAVAGNLLATRAGLLAAGRSGGLAVAGGWLASALLMASRRPGGSVVLPGSGELAVPALVYLIGGSVAAGLGALLGRRAPA